MGFKSADVDKFLHEHDGKITKFTVDGLSKAFWSLAHHYEIPTQVQSLILGIPYNKELFAEYEQAGALPKENKLEISNRVNYLLEIHEDLKKLFPNNIQQVHNWPRTKHQTFNNRTAYDYLAHDSGNILDGLISIKTALEFALNRRKKQERKMKFK